MTEEGELGPSRTRVIVGVVLAPALFVAVWAMPLPLSVEAHRLAAIFVAVIVLWITEAVPIAVTALLIAPAMVAAGVTDAKTAFAPYADPLLFLFVGGFMIARAMTRHGLDRRIALGLVSLPFIRGAPVRVRMAFVIAAVVLSMWISNTATTAILLPIMIGLIDARRDPASDRAVTGSLLAIAYACSIGGLGTPVGSPPNLIALRFLRDAGADLSFFDWMKIALPTALLVIVAMHFVLGRMFPPVRVADAGAPIERPRGRWSRGEITTMAAFGLAVVGWMVPGVLEAAEVPGGAELADHLPEGAVALLAASILFFVPDAGGDRRVLPWSDAARIDWGIIMLFGGGISLGRQVFDTGLAQVLAEGFVEVTGVRELWTLTALVTVFTIFFTETTSNTATANMLAPLVVAVAAELGLSPVAPVLGVGLAASCAFMLPIATGPNAIAYGTGRVDTPSMLKAGFVLNVVAAALIVLMLRVLCPLYGWT